MTNPTWKKEERRIANLFGTRRTPLSGENSAHTGADTLHPELFLEIKNRKKIPFWTVWKETRERAKKENKIPIVVMHQTGGHDAVAMVSVEWLAELYQKGREA